MARRKTVTITVRLTAEEERALDRLAEAWGLSRSAAVRRAVEGEESRVAAMRGMSLHDRMRESCGKFRSGRTDMSMRSRMEYERYIEEKHRGRGSR